MVRGRKPLASAAHRASGAYQKNPQRENKQEPKPAEGVPNKPAHIAACAVASSYWDHAVAQLVEMKLICKADRSVLEKFAEAMAFGRYAFECKDINEWKKASDSAKGFMIELGLTPSARSRLVVKDPEVEDDFTKWRKGIGGSDN